MNRVSKSKIKIRFSVTVVGGVGTTTLSSPVSGGGAIHIHDTHIHAPGGPDSEAGNADYYVTDSDDDVIDHNQPDNRILNYTVFRQEATYLLPNDFHIINADTDGEWIVSLVGSVEHAYNLQNETL